MGRYSTGKIHCHHCWNEGHNVKTCSKLAKDVKENLGGYYHRKYSKYFDEQGNRKDYSSVNNCSYCKQPGHTKRTCETKLDDMICNIGTNAKYRQSVWEWMKDKQVGVGSLVTIYDQMYLVTGINWDHFVCGRGDYNRSHLSIQAVGKDSGHYTSYIIDDEVFRGSRYYKDNVKVECGCPPQRPSEQWFKGGTPYYKDHRGRVVNVLEEKYVCPF